MGLGEREDSTVDLTKGVSSNRVCVLCLFFSFLFLSVGGRRRAQMGRMCNQLLSINFGNSLVA